MFEPLTDKEHTTLSLLLKKHFVNYQDRRMQSNDMAKAMADNDKERIDDLMAEIKPDFLFDMIGILLL